jgi:hypothetical protein
LRGTFGEYHTEAVIDPASPLLETDRMVRDGNWGEGASQCSLAARDYSDPEWAD